MALVALLDPRTFGLPTLMQLAVPSDDGLLGDDGMVEPAVTAQHEAAHCFIPVLAEGLHVPSQPQ